MARRGKGNPERDWVEASKQSWGLLAPRQSDIDQILWNLFEACRDEGVPCSTGFTVRRLDGSTFNVFVYYTHETEGAKFIPPSADGDVPHGIIVLPHLHGERAPTWEEMRHLRYALGHELVHALDTRIKPYTAEEDRRHETRESYFADPGEFVALKQEIYSGLAEQKPDVRKYFDKVGLSGRTVLHLLRYDEQFARAEPYLSREQKNKLVSFATRVIQKICGDKEMNLKGYRPVLPNDATPMLLPGKGFGHTANEYDAWQIAKGREIEREHISRAIEQGDLTPEQVEAITTKIAIDHLTEFPDYYTWLAVMEKLLETRADVRKAAANPERHDSFWWPGNAESVLYNAGYRDAKYKNDWVDRGKKVFLYEATDGQTEQRYLVQVRASGVKRLELLRPARQSEEPKQMSLFSKKNPYDWRGTDWTPEDENDPNSPLVWTPEPNWEDEKPLSWSDFEEHLREIGQSPPREYKPTRKPREWHEMREPIRSLAQEVMGFFTSLSQWNLKYYDFPDIEEWVRRHWNAPYGHREVASLLHAAAAERSGEYWNVSWQTRDANRRDLAKAQAVFRATLADLEGDMTRRTAQPNRGARGSRIKSQSKSGPKALSVSEARGFPRFVEGFGLSDMTRVEEGKKETVVRLVYTKGRASYRLDGIPDPSKNGILVYYRAPDFEGEIGGYTTFKQAIAAMRADIKSDGGKLTPSRKTSNYPASCHTASQKRAWLAKKLGVSMLGKSLYELERKFGSKRR